MPADAWRQSRPADAAQMDEIAGQPQAIWFGDWNPEPYQWVNAFLWIKAPGESDGECKDAPRAGERWPEYALDRARRASCGG